MAEAAQLHLAIIPDGNRRWARQQGLQPWQGHEKGIAGARALIDWAHQDERVGVLTLWGLSTENWNRPKIELTKLMEIYERFLRDERQHFQDENTRFVHSGRTDRIPKSLEELLRDIISETKSHTAFTLNFSLDYGGKDDVLRAIRSLDDPQKVTAESFRTALDIPDLPDIDIIIRTSGEQRTSNFFMWQAAYAEWFFLPQHFPELTPADLDTVVTAFSKRNRRFGA